MSDVIKPEEACLDGVKKLENATKKPKLKVVYITQKEIEDITEAGYQLETAYTDPVRVVEEIFSEDEKEIKSENQKFGDNEQAEINDPDMKNDVVKEDMVRMDVVKIKSLQNDDLSNVGEKMDIPDWVEYKNIHEEDEDQAWENMGKETLHVEMIPVRAVQTETAPAGFMEVDVEKVRKEKKSLEEEYEDCVDQIPRKEDWTQPIIETDSEGDNQCMANRKVKVWDNIANLRNVELGLHSRFKNAKIFRGVLKHYAAEKGFDYHYTKNEPKQVGVVCKGEDCAFYIWCHQVQHSSDLEIKTFIPNHSCERVLENNRITSDWLAERYKDNVRDNPIIGIEAFQKMVHTDLRANISDQKAYRAIKRAKSLIVGDTGVQYSQLYSYLGMITKTNPTSKWVLEIEQHAVVGEETTIPRFQRLYLRFGPEKEGFIKGCRPFIGIDGCHLKGYYGGQLLSAVAWDANDGMFPLAFAVVEQENKESWKWFLKILFEDFGYTEDMGWVFISDKQKGLVELFRDWIPKVEHRFCMRHMYENWYKDFKSAELKNMLWACAKANSPQKYEKKMEELKAMNAEAYEWLRKRPAKEWCKAFFTNRARSAIQTNSLSECFNSWISKGRGLPIIKLCEFLRRNMMNRFYMKKKQLEGYQGLLCPDIRLMVEYNKMESRFCFALPSGEGYYEVDDRGDTYSVNLSARNCTCLDWQLSGIPCKHALSAIVKRKDKPELYVDQYYHVETFKSIYAGQIFPVPGMDDWPSDDRPPIQPPIIQKPPGRPRMKRRKNIATSKTNSYKVSKKGIAMTCSRCKKKGHNTRSCTPKDYGETPAERKKRKAKNIVATNVDAEGPASSVMGKKPFDVNIEKKRKAALNKLQKRRKGANGSAEPETTTQCTPEQIEQKRQAALNKMRTRSAQKSQEEAVVQEDWKTGIYRTKKQKLQVIRRHLKVNGCQSYDTDSSEPANQRPTIPSSGLAQSELNKLQNHEWEFTTLQRSNIPGSTQEGGGNRGKGRTPAATSRFAQEVQFCRSATGKGKKINTQDGVADGGAQGAFTQPITGASNQKNDTYQSSSQP